MAILNLTDENSTQSLYVENNNPVLLPLIKKDNKSFLGWNKYPSLHYGYMNCTTNRDLTLHAIYTDSPAYILESYFTGDPDDYIGAKCHFRRYVIDVYLENAKVDSGSFKIENCNNILYYVGSISEEGICAKIIDDTDFHGHAYIDEGYITTSSITVDWNSNDVLDATSKRKKILSIMLYFSKWDMGYAEIERRTSDDILIPDYRYKALAGDERAYVSANFYKGIINKEKAPDTFENVQTFFSETEADKKADGELLTRFAVLADTHVGVRYGWENYDWLYGVFDNLEKIHNKTPLDFVLQLGDNIDDGYEETYKRDYDIYLDIIKSLKICDPQNPIENRAPGTIPNYEMQGNHDTTFDTRFFRNKLWYVENKSGKKTAFISFFAGYGGYPAVNFGVCKNYDSYRSYGIITDEILKEAEENIIKAHENHADEIILCNHFGISQELSAPVLPETGLGKIEQLCNKYNIKLYLNGHEHNQKYELRRYNNIYDYDAAMTKDKYAIFEIQDKCFKVTVYNTEDNSIDRIDVITL